MVSLNSKKFIVSVIVYFGHSDDHAETDSGWELRKHETSDNNSLETTPMSKFRPAKGVHATGSDSTSGDEECMPPSRRRSLFPDATDDDIEAVNDDVSGDDSLRYWSVKRIRTVSEVMRQLVRPSEPSLVAPPTKLESLKEGSSSSTLTERTTTSSLPISSSTSKQVSKD